MCGHHAARFTTGEEAAFWDLEPTLKWPEYRPTALCFDPLRTAGHEQPTPHIPKPAEGAASYNGLLAHRRRLQLILRHSASTQTG